MKRQPTSSIAGRLSASAFDSQAKVAKPRSAHVRRDVKKHSSAHEDAELMAAAMEAQKEIMENYLLDAESRGKAVARGKRPGLTGIQGVSVGYKYTAGSPTPEIAVKVYVQKKTRLRSDVSTAALIPKTCRNGVKTDVIQRPAYKLCAGGPLPEPLNPGQSVVHQNGLFGTMTCLVASGTKLMILSASHVIALSGMASPNDTVYFDVPGSGTYPIGFLVEGFTDLRLPVVQTMDAALAVTDPRAVNTLLPDGSQISEQLAALTPTTAVKKFGRHGFSVGSLVDVNAVENVPIGNGRFIQYGGQIGVLSAPGTTFAQPGDSGALVLTQTGNRPVGMLVARAGNSTLVTPMRTILDYFRVRLIV